MRLIIIAALVLGTLALSQVPRTPAQGPDANGAPAAATQADAPHPLVGKWTYRSFRSDPDQATEPNALLFGQGTLEFDTVSPDRVTGTLGGEGWQLNLTGRMEGTSPVTVRFQGKGVINGEEWVYDYAGYLVPRWPNGVDQRPAVVGSIVRTKAHSQGTAKAGYVAQWIAVRQDATPPAPRERLTAPAAGADALLRKLQVEWAAAVGSNDPDRIGRFFGNDFLFVGAGGVLQNRAEHLNDFRTGRLKVQSVTVKDVTVVARETYALTSTLTSVKGTFAGADITADYRFMDTFERTKSGWFAVARQQTKVAKSPSPTAVALPPPATFRAATGSALIRHNPSSIHAPFGNLYSHGVEIPSGARLLYIAGQAGVSKDGKVPADPDAQLDLAWANLKAVLNTAGMTVNDLVKVNCYIKEAKYTDAYARSVQRHLPTLKPAMTAPVVRQLWSEDWYVEIDGVAAKLPAWGQAAPAATGAGEKAAQPQSTSTDKLRRMYQEEDRREQLRKGNLAPNASPRATEKAGPSPDSEQLRRMYEEEDRREQLRRQNLAPSTPRPESSPVKVIRSVNGALQATLEVKYGMVRIGNHDVWLRTYNGQPVGPTLRAKAGDTLYITLVNRLPVEPPSPGHPSNGHHDWNTTNLHFHGLHVAPQGTKDAESDNVLLKLKPSDPFDPAVSVQKYAVKIPGNHVAGTFWYHAHNHGSVAAQVASGLAGALIIERDDDRHNLDSVPAVRAAAEDILLLQQVPYLKVSAAPGTIERVPEGSVDAMLGPGAWRNLGRYITTNGTRIPTITIAPGEVRRLRFIHSGQREAIRLKIERPPASGKAGGGPAVFPFHEIATDGLPTGTCRQLDMLNLFPGYRSDVLVRAPDDASGEYYLVDTEWDDRETGLPRPEKGADGSPELLRWVAKIVVAGPRRDMRLPEQHELAAHALPSLVETPGMGLQHSFYGIYFPPLNLPPPEDELRFMVSRRNLASKHDDFVKPTEHLDKEYDPTNVRRLVLGRTEKWVVGSRNSPNPVDGGGPPAAVTHPFHIHTNPFLVTRVTSLVEPGQVGDPVDVTAREIGSPTWRDTLALQQGYTYELLTRYEDFPGSFYQHCHILDHEDRGMMELVRIEDPARPAAAPVPPGRGQPPLRVSRTIPAADSNPSALLFVKGSFCTHCMRQLTEMAQELSGRNVAVTVVSGSTEDDLKDFPALPFTLVADPRHELFKRYRVFDGEAKHGIIVLDAAGRERLRKVGDAPFTDTKTVLAALGQAAPGFMIAVRGTDAPADDYITWSPTPCTIRMTNGTPGDPPVTVTLTNDDLAANPTAGELRFATTLAPGATAGLTSITLELKSDGTQVNFFVAGVKPSTLTRDSLGTGGRDTKIVIRRGGESGTRLSDHAVMVRVRKALRHPDDPRAKITDFELSEFLKALRDLHMVDNRLEWYVRMHRLATPHGTFAHPSFGDPPDPRWPDQAHGGSAFIAWHRAFLLQFERELQVRYPYVALPYWVQGTRQTFFAEDRLGVQGTTGDPEVVRFRPGSPLYGWSISLPGDRPGTDPVLMGRLRRRPLDHNDPSVESYRQWPDFAATTGIERFNVFRNVEGNPHNNGHGAVGPDFIWMSNCRESNADPVFYLFHCNHDYLWAKWQYELDRFRNDGDPLHYFPPDSFRDKTADQNIPLGHHLKDTMWPWDGTTGQVVAGVETSNRPDTNGFGDFPAARVPGLWPPTPARPRPADVIDYLGVRAAGNDLGFCYDDVPFGARPRAFAGPLPAVDDGRAAEALRAALTTASNRAAGADTRLLALRSLPPGRGPMTPEFAAFLARSAADPSEPPEVRSEALRRWFVAAPAEALDGALRLMADEKAPLTVRLTALAEAGRQVHFSEVPHRDAHRVTEGLQAVLRGEAPPPMKAAAARRLAPSGDSLAKAELLAALEPDRRSALQPHEAIALLRFFPDQKDRLRGLLTSANDHTAVAAIQALFKDADSVDRRRGMAKDGRLSLDVRRAAVQSLIDEDKADLTGFLVGLAADPAVELGIREEALAAAAVRLRRGVKAMSDADKRGWAERLRAVPAADSTDLGILRRDATEVVAPGR